MDYCGNCGEPLQGRFCRMCGTPVGAGTATGPGVTALAATPGYGGGYAPGQTGVQPIHQGYPAPAVPAGYGPEPTELFTATPTEFDGLFRSEDGSPGAYGQTQLLPPVVEADYRMPPPGASPPPGRPGREDPDGNGPRSNRPVVLATVGAVVVAAGVILGLLYLGNQSTSSGTTASAGTSTGPVSSASVSQNGGQISVPTDGATLGPTATTPSTAATTPSSPASTAAGDFHGDSLPLGPGSSGDWVKWVQQRLKQLGYYHGSDSGSFDQATALAVQQFQADAGVTGDAASTVGLHTIVALEAAGDTPNLRMGDRSPDVARLNAALTYATGTRVSGSRYSTATEADVFGYQQAVGLNPTGQVDAATWAKLQDGTLASG